ncbi:MAG TPA: hypothetical protein VJ045_01710 [Hyphomicrobiaceae bacterium]|nr:hypothetical protein [Hyphomicrobiaceae bacterium]
MVERTTVRLEEGLLRAARKKAAAEGRTLTSLIEEGLRQVIYEDLSRKAQRKPFKIPVSKAKGGPRPGVDLTRTSELLELLDEGLPPEKRR